MEGLMFAIWVVMAFGFFFGVGFFVGHDSNTNAGTPPASHNGASKPCQHVFFAQSGCSFVECKYCGRTFDCELSRLT